MWTMVLLVLDDATKVDDVLKAWEVAGARGATVMESSGMGRKLARTRDTMPLFPSLSSLMGSERRHNFTLFTIVDDDRVSLEVLANHTEAAIGASLDGPNTGIFVAWPVSYVRGVRRE